MRRRYRLAALVIGLMSCGWLAAPAHAQTINFRDKSTGTAAPLAIGLRGVGTVAAAGTTSLTCPSVTTCASVPAGTQADDVLIAIIEQKDTSTTTTMPAGWNPLYANNNGLTSRATLFWKRAVGGEPDPTITRGGSPLATIARIVGFYNVDWAAGNPFDATTSASTSNGTTANKLVSAAAITTVTESAVLVFAEHMNDDHASIALPAGWGTQAFFSSTTQGTDGAIAAHYSGAKSPPNLQSSVTGTVTFSGTSTNGFSNGALLALRPKPGDLSIPKPPLTVSGDVMIASIAYRSTNPVITKPAGWNLVRRIDNSTTPSVFNGLAVYWKQNTGDTGPYIWTFSPAAVAAGAIQSFSGVDTTNPIDLPSGEGGLSTPAVTSFSTPDVTTTVANAMLVTSHAIANTAVWDPAQPSGMTQAVSVNSGAEGLLGSWAKWAVPGLTGARTAQDTSGQGADNANAHILALRPWCAVSVSDPSYVSADAQNGQVTVYWPSGTSVVILGKSTPFESEAPANLTTYSAPMTGGSLGTAVVKYVGPAGSFNEGIANGSSYFYKVFVDAVQSGKDCYSPGIAVDAKPMDPAVTTNPKWGYSTTFASMVAPALDPWSNVVLSGSNDKNLHGIVEADGTQAFTNGPLLTGGPIQTRPATVPAAYRTPATAVNIGYVTSQDGSVYAVDTGTGAKVWQSPSLASMLQGGPNVWIQALNPTNPLLICGVTNANKVDVVFVGTRASSTSANKVYALNGSGGPVTTAAGFGGYCPAGAVSVPKGDILWTFTGGAPNPNMDIISSIPYVDSTNNAVWVTSASNGGTGQPSLWKLKAANGMLFNGTNACGAGASMSCWSLGDIDSSPVPNSDGSWVLVGTNAGTLKAIRVSDGTVITHTPASGTGAIKGMPWPLWYDATGLGGETIVFTRDTTVHAVNFNGTTSTFTTAWTKTLTGASGPISLVQQNTGNASPATSVTVTLTNPTTVGNLLVMVGANYNGGLQSVTGGGVISWSRAAGSYTWTNEEIWYGVVSAPSTTGVTATLCGGCGIGGQWMNLSEWSGLSKSAVLDVAAAASCSSPTCTSTAAGAAPGITTTNANDLLIFAVANGPAASMAAPTPGAWTPMTAITTPDLQNSWYQVVSATGTYNPASTQSPAGNWDAAIVAFKKAPAAPTVSAPVDDGAGHIYVGGSDGKVHQLDAATGLNEKMVPANGILGTLGDPTFNVDVNRIHVGGSDGHIYTFTTPF